MKSFTINITERLTKISNYINSHYQCFKQYNNHDFLIPVDMDTNLLTKLLKLNNHYIKENNPNIEEILYITNYFQLNNIILKLKYNNMSEYNEKYDIIKKKYY